MDPPTSPDTGRLGPIDEFAQPLESIPEISLDGTGQPPPPTGKGKGFCEQGHHGWPVVYRDNKNEEYYWKSGADRTMYILNCPTRGADLMPDLATFFMNGTTMNHKSEFTWVYELNFNDGVHVLTSLLAAPKQRPEKFVKLRPIKIREEDE